MNEGEILEKLIDLSHTIKDDMPIYPGDIRTNLFQTHYLNENGYNDYRLDISMHSGTHVDSPMHLTESREYVSEAPLESFIGVGCVLDVRNQPVIQLKTDYDKAIPENGIVLLYTGWEIYYGTEEYFSEHPTISLDFCSFLLKKRIKILGMDMPSPDKPPFPVHKLLLQNGIFIMENLANLDKLFGVESFEVIAFPLKIKADSSIVRAVARVI